MMRTLLLSTCVLSLGLCVVGCSMNGAADDGTCCIFDANGLRLDDSHERVRAANAMSAAPPIETSQSFSALILAQPACEMPASLTPAIGFHKVGVPLEWYRGAIPVAGAAPKQFWFTVINPLKEGTCTEEKQIILVAGSLGPTGDFSAKPPEENNDPGYRTGLCIQHFPDDGPPRSIRLVLNSGFIWAFVQKPTVKLPSTGPKLFWPWRLVIKTQAVPAGAFSTEYALLGLSNKSGNSYREFLFRPNQSCTSCAAPAAPDNMTGTIVYGQPFDGTVEKLTYPQQIRIEGNKANVGDIVASSHEEEFLKVACEFAHVAKDVIQKTPPNEWEKCDRPCFETPPAK